MAGYRCYCFHRSPRMTVREPAGQCPAGVERGETGSAGGTECLVALLEPRRIRLRRDRPWHLDPQAPHLLQAVPQHRTVDLFEDVPAHLNHEIRPNAEHVPVVCPVVDAAQCEPVGDHSRSSGMSVRKDVRRVEQVGVP